ncbi:MAG: 4-hydroxybenzoate octaprenyltransferase [Pseudomonadota bacterium]|nr:4-hydroxybenzoate octaprenyltransferase [Pseudomonadota bacterium]
MNMPQRPWRDRLWAYVQLTRFDRPVGIELLLWPTLWAVWLAGQGQPAWSIVLIFSLGAVFMRAAGCAINDFADRKFDGRVARTQHRPLASGRIAPWEALLVFAVLVLASASLLLFLPLQVLWWSFGALGLATLYPFMKRFTYLPQFVLGAAFSWAIPMAYVAQGQTPDLACWLLYAANLCWTVAYDTQYAMTDRPDDVQAGVKSTAILFGRYDLLIIAVLQGMFIGLLAVVLLLSGLGWPMVGLLLMLVGLFAWQYQHCRDRVPAHCFAAFLHNRWVGRLVFVGIVGLWSLV